MMFLGFKIERVMFSNCFSPALKLSPFYEILVSNPSLFSRAAHKPVLYNAFLISESANIFMGSKF